MIITKKQIEEGLLIFTLISVFITDFLRIFSNSGISTFEYVTYISVFLSYVSILIFFRIKVIYGVLNVPKKTRIVFAFWLTYLIINLARGLFTANGYWEYKFLFLYSTLFTLIATVFYVGQNLFFTHKIFIVYLKKFFLFGFILLPIGLATNPELYARLMFPIGVFILVIPYLPKNWVILIIAVAITSIFAEITFRSNIIKIALSLAFLFMYYFRNLINTFFIKFVWASFFVIPIILLLLGVYKDFNVFEEMSSNEEYTTINADGEIESLSADTRTFLYVEVIADVVDSGLESILIGKSPSQGYMSDYFYDPVRGADGGIRYSSEVNILNIFLHFGLVGVFLFSLLLIIVSYTAINKTNNRLSKMMGLLIASRFMLSFIEEFTQYDLNFYFFWLVMGLVSSARFRTMTDRDIKLWLQHGSKFLKTKVVN